jgi:chromosome segregation protein
MYLKKLEMIGFKSFCNKTILNFEPGITAVVGPNGCGKSNIFDSIRWVLGEQSVKALRGSEMQDVIFNGTDFREPLGMAEVNLFFDNSRRFFNIDQEEMVITRRIFRSGESEYLLNKNIVRLKDILDLLAGTGVGAESYSLIAQGKIDLILSARPEERRLVFDEAAGITKYKAQKREATRKLEEAEQNFLRVNDIITEVKRQIGSLERQANKARRYKEVFEELKNNEADLAVLEKGALIKEKDEVIRQLTELETEEARLLEVIRGQEAKISNRQEELRALEANIMSVKNEILNLENLVTRNQEHISFNEERVKELEETRIYLESQIGQLNNKLLMDEEKLSHLQEEYNGIRNNIEAKKIALAEKENEFQILTKAIKDSLENIADSKKEILELAAKIAGAKNETHDLMSREQVHLARKKRLELERAKVNEEKSGIDAGAEQFS